MHFIEVSANILKPWFIVSSENIISSKAFCLGSNLNFTFSRTDLWINKHPTPAAPISINLGFSTKEGGTYSILSLNTVFFHIKGRFILLAGFPLLLNKLKGFPGELNVAAGSGMLMLKEVQLESGKCLAVEDFLRGCTVAPGTILG